MSTTPPQLKPLGVGDILDQSVRIYRRNFVTLIAIVAVIAVPVALIQVLAAALTLPWTTGFAGGSPFVNGGALTTLYYGASFIAVLVGRFFSIFQIAALASFISAAYLGQTLTFSQAYARAFSHWLSLIIASILVGLAAVAILTVIFIPIIGVVIGTAALSSGSDNPILAFGSLGFCCLLLPALAALLFFAVRWAFFAQAIVIENYNSTGGLGRSWKLGRGIFWRTLGFILILSILVIAFTAGPSYLIGLLALVFPSAALATIISTVATSILEILVIPIQLSALTLYYYDLRVRKEGLDLQLKLNNTPTDAAPPDLPSLIPTAGA